jgi:peptidyl-prolyl cis-trans isomerase A (cyclophilin A)
MRKLPTLSLFTFVALVACTEKAPSPSTADSAKKTAPAPSAAAPAPTGPAALLTPDPAKLAAPAPDSFTVQFITSKGAFDVKVHRDWAPHGADRIYYLASNGFFDGVRFFRVLDGFMAQFGVNGNPAVDNAWRDRNIPDDPVKKGNKRGILTFAQTNAPNTRGTQLFINYKDNAFLDKSRFAGVGEVVKGMPVVDSLYKGYGEAAPEGRGPDQTRIGAQGNKYLAKDFPLLDSIVTTKVAKEWRGK